MDNCGRAITFRQMLRRVLAFGLLIAVLVSSTGCSVIELLYPRQIVQTPVPLATEVKLLPSATSQPPPATQTPLPTYTLEPTYTLPPTYTPLPTYTLPPTLTSIPVYILPSPIPASPTVYASACCTLRVRNRSRITLWIGTVLPYGGNYISPGQYVEFYLPGATWVRVWWCRYRGYKNDKWYEGNPWKSANLYACQHTDVYADEPLKEISVR